MKRKYLVLITCILFAGGVTMLYSCGNSGDADYSGTDEAVESVEETAATNEEEHNHELAYQCPMQCEGDKTYAEAGECGVCEMDLEQLAEHHEHADEDSDHDHAHEGDDHDGHEH